MPSHLLRKKRYAFWYLAHYGSEVHKPIRTYHAGWLRSELVDIY